MSNYSSEPSVLSTIYILIPCLLALDRFCFYREDKPEFCTMGGIYVSETFLVLVKIGYGTWVPHSIANSLQPLSSPELKVQVSFSDHLLSFHLSVNFSYFYLFSRTTGPLSTKFCTKQPLVKGIKFKLFPFAMGNNTHIAKNTLTKF